MAHRSIRYTWLATLRRFLSNNMPSGPFPERFLKCMAKEDRAPLGKAGETIEEATARASVKLEREMHDQFAAWLRINGIPFIHARTDRKSTIQEGWPDFTVIYQGLALCIEFKMPNGRLSDAQTTCIGTIWNTGTRGFILTDSKSAIDKTKEHFNL